MKDINSALRSHRKPAKPEFYQLIVVGNFNPVISYQRLIENRFIVNIPSLGRVKTEPSYYVHNLLFRQTELRTVTEGRLDRHVC